WLVGTLRLGSLAHFISPSALFGFTSGAAVLIAVPCAQGTRWVCPRQKWLVGTLRLGSLAHFISPSALFGFTSGAAVLIA
ncbi:sulfate transporter, partial [Methylobacterium radiotolerans]